MNIEKPDSPALVEAAAKHVGNHGKLAALLGVTAQAVSNWKSNGIPADKCPSIERLTKGKVRCEAMRPDVDWAILRRKPSQPRISGGQPGLDGLQRPDGGDEQLTKLEAV